VTDVGNARVVLRPIGSPLPLGFLALFVATLSFSSVQLGWVPDTQGDVVALAAVGLAAPVQLLTSVFGFLARDPVAGTGMGILAGTWAAAGLAMLGSPAGTTSPGLGVVLLAAGLAMFVPAAGGREKAVAAGVMTLSGLRFIVTGIAEVSGVPAWMSVAGWTGVVLAVGALYAALAFELEGTENRDVLPLWRRGAAASAVRNDEAEQRAEVAREPGVRSQL
jgi:succinate-acetate transporter protein